ncbi:AmpG family muropeptide MFS transporter [Methylotetracoccus oryzae]|uniref:AmpG family muropeptide MFS transporter n=1 Tax=Methylotetracoccus oryzae TaxID=1919059 RepID=UPI0011180DFC|nr:AmpG family muropeptide MFS transporter [Methylotetracoccus oryzae]
MTTHSPREALLNRRMLICVLTGFSSGLPLFVLISLLSAWLREGGVDLKAIGLLALVQFPYIWKFLWAPLCDRYGFRLGRRRSWMLVTQLGLLLTLPAFGFFAPQPDLGTISALAVVVAFFSATQDIAIDAYRRELLRDEEQGLGNVIHVNAYKVSSLIPGSLSLILADHLSWQAVYWITALFMLPGLLLTLLVREPEAAERVPTTLRRAVVEPFREFVGRNGWVSALTVLAFIFFYKLGDSMATALVTPFYLDMGYSKTEIGMIAKHAGLWPNVAGGIFGGIWMVYLGTHRALWVFGMLQALVILGFAWLATAGHTLVGLASVIGAEAFGVGLGTAAFVAYIASTTNPAYTATQFALFTSLAATPRTLANAFTGFLVEGGDLKLGGLTLFHVEALGWERFFWLCFMAAAPGMLLLFFIAPWNGTPRSFGRPAAESDRAA